MHKEKRTKAKAKGLNMKGTHKGLINILLAGYELAGYEVIRGASCIYCISKGRRVISIEESKEAIVVLQGKVELMRYVK